MKINRTIFLGVGSVLLSSCASAQEFQRCPLKDSYHMSVAELVSHASFIGLFEVTEVALDEVSMYEDTASYTYTLIPASILKNPGPRIFSTQIVGVAPLKEIPQHYLAISERHGFFDLNDPGKLGTSAIYRLSDSSECVAAPNFKIGYTYLVFDGVDSKVAFEPIHFSKTDPWYLAVERAVGAGQLE